MDDTKICFGCEIELPISHFAWKNQGDNRRKNYCRSCSAMKSKMRIYGVDYTSMLDEQDGVCALCQNPETIMDHRSGFPHQLSVDHNHDTGEVRKLLCRRCNSLIADVERIGLKVIVDYLGGESNG